MSLDEDILKCSIVSIVPFPIEEYKPGLYPGNFIISPSLDGIPQILVIGTSVHHAETAIIDRSITITTPAHEMAKSIVDDYLDSQLAVNVKDRTCGPGIFWKVGVYNLARVYAECSKELEEAKMRQNNWFIRLVEMADDDWEKTRQHRTITDMQRQAARTLKLERAWIVEPAKSATMERCPACGVILMANVAICASCRYVVDPKKYATLQFASSTDPTAALVKGDTKGA